MRYIHCFTLLLLILASCSESGTNSETQSYNVTVTVTPSGAGSISPSAGGTYKNGEKTELFASENDGYLFTEWSGDVESLDNPLYLTVDQDYRLTANFLKKNYELTISTNGEGSVTERVVESQAKSYEHGTTVELTAEPDYGWSFIKWEGDVHATSNPFQITVDKPTNMIAVFEKNFYTLSISTYGEGTVTTIPLEDEYMFNFTVEIYAESDSYWEFESWSGDVESTENPLSVVIDSNKTITARFKNTLYSGGIGTEFDPYQISTLQELQNVRESLNAHFIQVNDIDASASNELNNGNGFQTIGEVEYQYHFTGSYDGRNYHINNLQIFVETPGPYGAVIGVGLFGYAYNSTLKNIHLRDVHVEGGSSGTGGIVGVHAFGLLENSSSTGKVIGQNIVGGLVGTSTSDILNSFSNSEVISSNTTFGSAGGLAGSIEKSTIENSYSHGTVTGDERVGGLVGYLFSDGKVRLSYSTASVTGKINVGGLTGGNCNTETGSFIELSYWNIETSGTDIGIGECVQEGAAGLTTTQMQNTSAQENMLEFDWDNTWSITDQYPILQWQHENQ